MTKKYSPTETARGLDYTLGRLYAAIDSLLHRNRLELGQIEGIGISGGGPLDHKTGTIQQSAQSVRLELCAHCRADAEPLSYSAYLQNDANACALAEWKFGAARGCSDVIFLTFGTGMGAGLILNGRLYAALTAWQERWGHIRIENNGPVGFGRSVPLKDSAAAAASPSWRVLK